MPYLSLDHQIASLAALRHGVFSMSDLIERNVSADQRRRRLETGRWIEVYDGVYRIAGVPPSWMSDLVAACRAGGTRAIASHRSAAALWELPGARRDILEITCPRWRRAQEQGLIVHEATVLSADDIDERDDIPVSSIERTLFNLAGVVWPTTLDLAIDNALRRELSDLVALYATLARLARRGRRGTQRFRDALTERDPEAALSASERERLLFDMLRRHGFPLPVPQYEILDETGNFVARPDFAYPDLKIAIEYESFQEHTGKVALVRDSARRNAVVALGWAPIAATAVDLKHGGNQLADALRRARNRRITEPAS